MAFLVVCQDTTITINLDTPCHYTHTECDLIGLLTGQPKLHTLKCRLRGESPYNFLTFFCAPYPQLGVGVCAPYPSY